MNFEPGSGLSFVEFAIQYFGIDQRDDDYPRTLGPIRKLRAYHLLRRLVPGRRSGPA